jgi:hypothetical protein
MKNMPSETAFRVDEIVLKPDNKVKKSLDMVKVRKPQLPLKGKI